MNIKNRLFINLSITFLLIITLSSTKVAYASETDLLTKAYTIKYINLYRSLASLDVLEEDAALSKAAESHAMYIIQNGKYDSIQVTGSKGFSGTYVWDRTAKFGFTESSLISEEILKSDVNLKKSINSIIANPKRRVNLLSPNSNKIGVAIIGSTYVIDIAQKAGQIEEKITEFPTNNQKNVVNYAYSDSKWEAIKPTLTYFSDYEIADVTLFDCVVRNVTKSKIVLANTKMNTISKNITQMIIEPKEKYEPSCKYQIRAAFSVKKSNGVSKNINKTWEFQTSKNVDGVDMYLRGNVIEGTGKKINDIQGHWCMNQINEFSRKGFIDTDVNGDFNPDQHITRAEMADIVVKAMNLPSVAIKSNFQDVNENDRYYKGINKAYQYGIMNGTATNQFSPNGFLTREEACIVLINVYEKVRGNISIGNEYVKMKDIKLCNTWSIEKVKKAIEIGMVNGKDNNVFCPQDKLTKAESITLINRLINLV